MISETGAVASTSPAASGGLVAAGLGILHQVAETVAQRRPQYGPAEHFEQVARRWSVTIGSEVRPEQVVLCLLDLKLVRLAHDPGHRDSLVDLIGYSMLLHELMRDATAEGPAAIAQSQKERRLT